MRGCYSGAGRLAHIEHELGSIEASGTQILSFDAPKTIDRVVVREDQTNGQAIRGWSVSAQLQADSPGAWTVLANGTSMGNKCAPSPARPRQRADAL